MPKDKTFLQELADKGWGEQGVYTGGAANAQGLAEYDARKPATTKTDTIRPPARHTESTPIRTTGPFAHYKRRDEAANLKLRTKSETELKIEAFLQNAKEFLGGLFVLFMAGAFIAQLFGVLP